MNDLEKIEYLSYDPAFGILTRPALELAVSECTPIGAPMYILDLADIHRKNITFGYMVVNGKIYRALKKTKETHTHLIMGRVFSGDEIVIIDPLNIEKLIQLAIRHFRDEQLGFRFSATKVTLGHPVLYYRTVFDSIVDNLNKHNYFEAIWTT